jgi:FixJ family two-component response regulator
MQDEPTVFVVDDDASVRNSLRWLLKPLGWNVELYGSASEFLEAFDPERPGCLVLDVRLPGITGLQLQKQLVALELRPPIIMITGHANVPMCVQAFEAGVFAFLEKPADEQALVGLVRRAIAHDASTRAERARRREIEARLATLTTREREVMDLIVSGKTTKSISAILGISVQTAARHRSALLHKMRVESPTELARLMLPFEVCS